eukprot:CAMPEP_0183295536 /NCGR_PEP_ID=MMETSP0160_2-20130417/3460_1 /TAXON_ID=2839 ORGANISM="Odontella Sinensis, Strain Grunow 1884" /NCGR_SAMPLE_ID=MMETSP0160_2 /ASSEMBLY_ACC=CAM_ASM_000250 /LENGTH=220 /DNA_ID=CAMNT_0025457031 /DNA_START=201 /DNA_END=863 /DNA_ORIENTATION=+
MSTKTLENSGDNVSPCCFEALAVLVSLRRAAHSITVSPFLRCRGSASLSPNASDDAARPSDAHPQGETDWAMAPNSSSNSQSAATTEAPTASAASIAAANSSLRGSVCSSSPFVVERLRRLDQTIIVAKRRPERPPVDHPLSASAGRERRTPIGPNNDEDDFIVFESSSSSSSLSTLRLRRSSTSRRILPTLDGATSRTTALGRRCSMSSLASSADSEPM